MAEPPATTGFTSPGVITVDVVAAALCFVLSAGCVGLATRAPQTPPSAVLLLGWPLFALAGGVVLDQVPGSRVGYVLTALGLVPVLDTLWAMARFGPLPSAPQLWQATVEISPLPVVAAVIGLPLAFRDPRHRASVRTTRRRSAWFAVTLATAGIVASVGWTFSDTIASGATTLAVVVTALVATRLCFVTDFRPLDEPLLDVLLVLAVAGAAAVVAVLVRVGAGWTRLPSPNTTAVLGAFLTTVMAAPAAVWARRAALNRRYGHGIISPADVAVITADLHAQTQPRDLLDKAARMVAAASGSPAAQIVLGEDSPPLPAHWVLHPLVVGGDRVGALMVQPRHREGPELRQQRIIAQLLPTVALVARAVGLAVEAEHARRDVARERDAERHRILADLHDGLGPLLAGMSMRVQAVLRQDPASPSAPLLRDLAEGLSSSRSDLRRIVAGITPSSLDGGDLDVALRRLVSSFQGAGGPALRLDVALAIPPAPPVQVAVYRCVAEGVTNALRHAKASCIDVRVHGTGDLVVVDVVDDGVGGAVVPGVGLSSLMQRAEGLGGRLELTASGCPGVHLRLHLPATQGSPS